MFKQLFENVRRKSPLVHCITNYVTVNDCANMLLACGGSPIMADEPDDAVEITAICGGLTINIGTLNQRTLPSMLAAGKRANELGHSVVLDPVGAGASKMRTDTALRLLKDVRFTAIRGNRYRGGGGAGFLYPQRPSGDVLHYRNRLPALCPDDGLCHRQPESASGGCRCRRVCHGPVRRDCLQAHDGAGRQRVLPELYYRCHVPPDPGGAGERSQI